MQHQHDVDRMMQPLALMRFRTTAESYSVFESPIYRCLRIGWIPHHIVSTPYELLGAHAYASACAETAFNGLMTPCSHSTMYSEYI